MFLLELKLRGVFDGHDAFVCRYQAREDVEGCRLASTGTTRYEYVQTALDRAVEKAPTCGVKVFMAIRSAIG